MLLSLNPGTRVSPRLLTVTDMFRSRRCALISVVLARWSYGLPKTGSDHSLSYF